MKKKIVLGLACLSMSMQAFADYCGYDCRTNCFGFDSVLTFDMGGGYRSDNLSWKRYPTATSEISEKWKNIGMGIAETNASFLACEHYLAKADFDCGWFSNSEKQRYEIYNSGVLTEELKSCTKGQVYNISGGLGYQFNFRRCRISLAPLVGYSYNYQKYKNNEYVNQLTTTITSTYPNNRYKYRWSGPWVGFATSYQPYCDISLFFDYEFHWMTLHSNIDEHFTAGQLPAHINSTNCYGNEFTTGADYVFCDGWFLRLKFDYKQFFANHPRYHVEGPEESFTNSHIHNFTWNSYNITLDIGYNF